MSHFPNGQRTNIRVSFQNKLTNYYVDGTHFFQPPGNDQEPAVTSKIINTSKDNCQQISTYPCTPIHSKWCSICYRLAVIISGSFEIPILGGRGVFAGWDLHQSKAHPRFTNTSQDKVLLYLPPFQFQVMASQFDPASFGG